MANDTITVDRLIFEGQTVRIKELEKQLKEIERKSKVVALSKYNAVVESMENFRTQLISTQKDFLNLSKELQESKGIIGGSDTFTKSEVDSLVKAIETEKEKGKQWERLYNQEKEKRNQTKIKLQEYQNKIDAITKTGRKRKNDIADLDVVSMKEEGKSLRDIAKETGLSINTIRDILKSVSK
jgi:hypothetical protein